MTTPLRPTNRSRRRANRTRGQALVEFALILPVFLLILCGVLDFGFMLYSRMTVINAAREGARAAATAPDPSKVANYAQNGVDRAALGMNLDPAVVACIPVTSAPSTCSWTSATSAKSGDAVRVDVTYTYHTFFPLLFGATFALNSTVQMTWE